MTGIFAVLLLILKILGIILLSLLGLVLLIILIILFVPVRYSIRAKKYDDGDPPYFAKAKITWLLHIVNVLVNYPSDELIRVRIFLFKVFPRVKKKKPSTRIEKKEDNNDNKDNEPLSDIPPIEKEIRKEHKSLIERIKDKISGIRKKATDFKNTKEKFTDIYYSDEFQASFALCKRKLLGILKSILPQKIKGKVTYGKEDSPDTVGMVYSLYSVLYSKIGKSFILTPDFERDILTGDVIIKGRIFIFVLIFSALRIYFDKNVKKLLKMLKKEKKNG